MLFNAIAPHGRGYQNTNELLIFIIIRSVGPA